MDHSSSYVIILIALVFCAFFSAMEIAFLSSNRLRIELERSKGSLRSRVIDIFYGKDTFFIALLLLGNNVALVLFGISSAEILSPVIVSWGIESAFLILLLQTLLSTLLVLSVAEFLPKALVQINPNGFLKIATFPMFVVYAVLYLPTHLIMVVSNVFLKLLKISGKTHAKVFTKIDLEHFVHDLSNRIHEEEDLGKEMQILRNALDFSNIKARDCMIPRTEIIAVEVDEDMGVLKKTFIEKGLSKILIYRESVDNIIGYVHSFAMFDRPESIKEVLMPIRFVPAATSGKELLQLFSKQSGNIAVVVDEYGGTAGVVTIEDVIEEIFGDIEDEYDSEVLTEEQLSEKEFRFSARIDIDYLNQKFNLGFPESDEYDTLGGFILHELETIPEIGETVVTQRHTLVIEEVTERRIELVRVVVH
ncbi:MAG: hemolysin family protein [Cryomorphaceae bacterium]|nr:hemolysin family protein [Cryomorphaceae bacterium]